MKKTSTPIYAAIALCVATTDASALGFNSSDLKALSAAFHASGYAMGAKASENKETLARAAASGIRLDVRPKSADQIPRDGAPSVAADPSREVPPSAGANGGRNAVDQAAHAPAEAGAAAMPVASTTPAVLTVTPPAAAPVSALVPVTAQAPAATIAPAVAMSNPVQAPPRVAAPTRWSAPARMPLRAVLRAWVRDSGWILDWDDDIPELRHAEVAEEWEGDFESAVRGLFQTLADDAPARAWLDEDKKVLKLAYIKPVTTSGWTVAEDLAGGTWSFSSGDKVKSTISAWVKRASWSMVWDARAKDIEIGAEADLRGSVEDALQGLSRLLGPGAAIQIKTDVKAKVVHVLPARGAVRGPARKPPLQEATPKHDA